MAAAVLLLSVHRAASAQLRPQPQAPPPQPVTVTVVNAHATPAQPVQSVRVSLSYVDGSSLITDALSVTNRDGQVLLQVSPDAAQRGDLRIEITGAADLAIYQPADGQLPALPKSIQISLLPKGSPALLGPAQIEATLRRALLQVSSLQQQNRTLKQEVATAQPQKQDLSAALSEWARQSGFSTPDVDAKVQQWGHDIQQQEATATCQQKALAQLALKNNEAAAAQFTACYKTALASLDDDEQTYLDARRKKLSAIVSTAQQAADADMLALHYHQATTLLDEVASTANAEYKKHPDDRGFHEIWLQALWSVADARWREGEIAPAEQSLGLLARSSQDYSLLILEYEQLGNAEGHASAEAGLANTYMDQGERTTGAESTALLAKSVQAFDHALEVYTKTDLPQDWASAQMNLGNAYLEQGERTTGAKSVALLAKAVQAYEYALEIYTKANLPQDWARTQVNLGNAYFYQAYRTKVTDSVVLVPKAVQAYEHALEVYTKVDLPQDWAATQINLGSVLVDQGESATGVASVALLAKAVQAYEHALEVYTKTDLPQNWARTQSGLGNAYSDQGERTTGAESVALLAKAMQAYEHALEVDTKADLPQDWARIQINLGIAYKHQENYTAAANALKSSLEVDPQPTALSSLAEILHDHLFDFKGAYEINQQRLKLDPSTSARMDFIEASLTVGRWSDCIEEVGSVDDAAIAAARIPIRDTMKLACEWGAGQTAASMKTQQALIVKAQSIQKGVWGFAGTLHCLSTSPTFVRGRDSWIALFTAVQNGDAPAMTTALHQLEPLFHPTPGPH
jgi:tetratricopeptide (TPR) repeat protein